MALRGLASDNSAQGSLSNGMPGPALKDTTNAMEDVIRHALRTDCSRSRTGPLATLRVPAVEMRSVAKARFGIFPLTLLLLSVLLGGCRQIGKATGHTQATIQFTGVPVAGADDPGKVSTIKGRVTGAEPGQRIVLYSKGAATWWVQPFTDHPFTEIHSDSTWKSLTHPGTQYAALLVGPAFNPPPTADELPTDGVFAVAITQGELPFWLRWWFLSVYLVVGLLAVL